MAYGKRKAYRAKKCPNIVAGKVNSEIWNGNLLSSQNDM